MSVVAELSVPATDFALGRALRETSGLSVELERVIPTGGTPLPYFWVLGTDRDDFDAVLDSDPALASFAVVDDLDERALYRVEWSDPADDILQLIVDSDAVLQDAGGTDRSWEFTLRFANSHELSEFHDACREADLDLSVDRLQNPIQVTEDGPGNLTEAQRTILVQAFDDGYFEVPRRTTLVELSEQIGVSDQAVNERMRRGLHTLIRETLKSGASTVED